jgi:hypothetical protein
MECFRFTRDRMFLAEMWPAARKAAQYIEQLRAKRMTSDFASGEKRARYGLLPESASHEGYLAHPVHSYWDDFWALRGLSDAVEIAGMLGDDVQQHLIEVRDGLRETLYASIEQTMRDRQIEYVPGSVEWADFDPTATSVALSIVDGLQRLPRAALQRTYDQYLEGFRKRRDGVIDWNNYTAYEVRIIGALVRLGEIGAAHELTEFLIADRRPAVWNQWPEISWRDPRSPGHLGDLPHSWIGAEYLLSLLSMFAFEDPCDDSLVLAAGVSEEWLAGGFEVAVRDLPTYYGPLSYRLRQDGRDAVRLSLSGLHEQPHGGIRVHVPFARVIRGAEINGQHIAVVDRQSVSCRICPADIVIRI